jgi:hypothetical protein
MDLPWPVIGGLALLLVVLVGVMIYLRSKKDDE